MATKDLEKLFEKKIFDYSKPYLMIKFLFELSTNPDSIILDSFAGSGTTGHAVLDLNKEDYGNRKFIIIEMEDEVVKEVTTERIKRAIKKYEYNDGFEYCELDKPLFDEEGKIYKECTFEQLASYIYFTETQTNLEKNKIQNNLVGTYNDTSYYLLFKGIGKNILNKEFLKRLKKDSSKKVIYADKCLIDETTLKKHNAQFKQIPYEVKIY